VRASYRVSKPLQIFSHALTCLRVCSGTGVWCCLYRCCLSPVLLACEKSQWKLPSALPQGVPPPGRALDRVRPVLKKL